MSLPSEIESMYEDQIDSDISDAIAKHTSKKKEMTKPIHTNLSEALLAAQAEMPKAVINKVNPHFKNRYADLEAVRDACIPVFTKHGILVTQTTMYDTEGRYILRTTLTFASGEPVEAVFPLPETGKPQEVGACLTYARRYTLSVLSGLTSEEDSDGENAGMIKRKEPDIGFGNEQPHGKPEGGVTKFKTKLRGWGKELRGIETMDELAMFLTANKQLVLDAAWFLPGWWVHAEGGLRATIETIIAAAVKTEADNQQAHILLNLLTEADKQERK